MAVWPVDTEDTVNYRERDIISVDDINIRMIDRSILNIWGEVYHNGTALLTSPSSTGTDLAAFGAKYDGSDESAIFQEAVDDIPAFSNLHISGPLALGTPVLCRETLTITGEGLQSPISPFPGYPGGPLLEFRHSAAAEGSAFSHLQGIVLDNLVFDGKNRTIPCEGLRFFSTQEMFCSRLRFHNIDGIGLNCQNSVRDSIFQTIMTRMCGNYDRNEAAVSITAHTGLGQDTHNNLCWLGLWCHVSNGDQLHLQCETPNNLRCFFFLGSKFHGVWTPGYVDADGITYGHMTTGRVVIRNARGVEFTNCRFHESAAGMPLIVVGPHPLQPGSNSTNSVGFSQCSLGNPGTQMTFSVTAAADNGLTFAATHYFASTAMVRATASTITGISLGVDYFVIRTGPTSIKLAASFAEAEAGTPMTIGSTGTATFATQECRIFVPESTYGSVSLWPGVDIDGISSRVAFVSKSHLQVIQPFMGSKYLQSYEGIVTQNDFFNHIEIDADLNHDGTKVGFYGTTPVIKPSGLSAAQALSALGLGSSLIEGGVSCTEYPPLTKWAGTQWFIPSVGHLAIWYNTSWRALYPSDPALNACCILGNLSVLIDPTAWDGTNYSGNFVNYGLVSAIGFTANGNVTKAIDGGGRGYAVFNGTSTDAAAGAHTAWDVAAGDSFSMFVVKSQSSFVADTALFTNRQSLTTPEVGWGLQIADTAGAHRFRMSDGTTVIDATSGAATGMRLILGVRNVSTDNINIYGTPLEATTGDTTTGTIVSANAPRIGRAAGTGTARSAMNFYLAGFVKRALSATEITTLKALFTARYS